MFPDFDLSTLPCVCLSQKASLAKCPAIYFAIDSNNNVFYVGKAINLLFRWRDHHRFEQLSNIHRTNPIRIAWWECEPQMLTQAEKHFIKIYKPLLNDSLVPTIPKGDFSIAISKLSKNTVVTGLFKRLYGYELKLSYEWQNRRMTNKVGQLVQQCHSSFVWDKEVVRHLSIWTGVYTPSSQPQQIKVTISPCVLSGLLWEECTQKSIKLLVTGVLTRVVDWRSHFSIPDEENFLDLTKLDELISD